MALMDNTKTIIHKSMSNKCRRIFCSGTFILCLFFLSLAIDSSIMHTSAEGAEEVIDSERIVAGTGIIFNQNVAYARNEAISQAFVKAVEEYLVQRLGPRTMANNFQRLDDAILSKAKKGILDYEIISEFISDKQFKVLLKIQLDKAILEKELESMELAEINKTHTNILFLVSEKEENNPVTYWWGNPSLQTSFTQTELFLSQAFEIRGFRVINRAFFPPEESYDESMLNATLTDEAAVRWGQLLSAGIVITGEANLYGEQEASVFLKAIRVKDGTIISQGYREAIAEGDLGNGNSAVESSINRWANDMIPNILQSVRPAQSTLNHITVIIRGIKSYQDFWNFKEFLKKSSTKIQSVLEKSMNRSRVELSVDLKGDPQDLAESLLDHPEKPYSFEINNVDNQVLEFIIK